MGKRAESTLRRGLTLAGLFLVLGAPVPAAADNLVRYTTVTGTDFAMFGQGGLRGNTTGSIAVSGISGTVTRVLLVWHGPTLTGSTTNAALTFAGTPLTGAPIGTSADNQWAPFTESRAYVADVTALVPGDGTYLLTGLANSVNAAMNGASLLVFYNDGNASNNRDIVLFLGNDSNRANSFDTLGWSATLNGINYSGGTVTLRLVVSDGQTFSDMGLDLNGSGLVAAGQNWDGNTVPNAAGSSVIDGGLWDHAAYDVTSFMTVGVTNLALVDSGSSVDALSLIGAVFDLPAGSAPPVVVTPALPIPTLSQWATLSLALALSLAVALARRTVGADVK